MQHQQEGRRILEAVLEKLADVSKVERPPAMEGKRMTALLSPKPGAKAQPKKTTVNAAE
jgi:translation initiation factor IF-3